MWKFLIILIFISFSFAQGFVNNSCVFEHFDIESNPLFLQKFGAHYYLFAPYQKIEFEDGNDVILFCEGGIRKMGDLERSQFKETKKITLSCSDEAIKLTAHNYKESDYYSHTDYEISLTDYTRISCYQNHSNIFEYKMRGCSKSSFAIASIIENKILSHAEFCFNVDDIRLEFVHYVLGERTANIDQLANLSDVTYWPHSYAYNKEFSSKNFKISNKDISEQIELNFGSSIDILQYTNTYLVPVEEFEPYFNQTVMKGYILGNVIMWKGLKEGNWQAYKDLLHKRTRQMTYDVYAGTLGNIEFEKSMNEKQCEKEKVLLTIKNDFVKKTVAKYIWNYLTMRNGNVTEEFIVFGVNSPFVTMNNYRDVIFCNDVCNYYPWLMPIEKIRKMPALGIIFCCKQNDVRIRYPYFPEINQWTLYPIQGNGNDHIYDENPEYV